MTDLTCVPYMGFAGMAVASPPIPSRPRTSLHVWFAAAAGLVLVAIVVVAILLATHWPFSRGRAIHDLEKVSLSNVSTRHFEETFFPHPGCVLEDVSFTRGSGQQIGSIQKLKVEGSWTALFTFTHYIPRIRAEGFHVFIPSPMPEPVGKESKDNSNTAVGELIADGATLQVRQLVFAFPKLTFHNVGKTKRIHIDTLMRNPEPPDDIQASFDIGPWHTGNAGSTPASGTFDFQHADLGHYHGIAGTLSAKGEFKGILEKLQLQGSATVPNFEVTSSHHAVALQGDYKAIVNALKGDTELEDGEVNLLRTHLSVHGTIAGRAGEHGKFVDLVINSQTARIQDLLRLFVTAKTPPLDGPIVFRAHVLLPPGKQQFERRVRLDADFGITDAEFTNKNTQANVDKLSERARGEKDKAIQNVVSDLKGHVQLRDGVATFTNLSFTVPGARAQLAGTFNLISKGIDLKGRLATEASLSNDTGGGFMSFLLKPLDPLFKKKHAGAVIPVQITGRYPHPSYHYSLLKK